MAARRRPRAEREAEGEEVDTDSRIAEIVALGLAPEEEHKEICTFMAKKFAARWPAVGAPQGAAGRFQPGGGGGFGPSGAAPRPPTRDRNDVSFVNRGRKGLMALEAEARQRPTAVFQLQQARPHLREVSRLQYPGPSSLWRRARATCRPEQSS